MKCSNVNNAQEALIDALEALDHRGRWVGEKKEIVNFATEIGFPGKWEGDIHAEIISYLDNFHGDNHYHTTTNWTFPTREVQTGLTSEPTPTDDTGEYFERLCDSPKGNQLASMVEKIEKWGRNNRTVAQVFQVERDLNAMFPPCLCTLQAFARDGEVSLTAHFRSHTVAKSYYGDVTALCRLVEWLASETDMLVGSVTVISGSLHIRKKNDENGLAEDMLEGLQR